MTRVDVTAGAPPRTDIAVRLHEVSKVYRGRGTEVAALRQVSLSIPAGAFLAVMGPSGSGKSSLLHCAAGLDTPTDGTVHIGDTEISGLNEAQRTRLRRERIGFVFQSYNLIPSLTVMDNITLPLRLAGSPPDPRWVRELVHRVGLDGMLARRPTELSGGQQQRAAIARALVARPDVVFADEPTGALDLATAREVLRLLGQLVAEYRQTVVMVTHDPAAAAHAAGTVVVADGRIAATLTRPSVDELAHQLTHLERN